MKYSSIAQGGPEKALAVTGLGMVSSLGPDLVTSCAASRAGIVRAQIFEDFHVADETTGEPIPIVAHDVTRLTKGLFGLGRQLALAKGALDDLLWRHADIRNHRVALGLILVVGSDALVRSWIASSSEDPDARDDADWDEELETLQAQSEVIDENLLPRFLKQSGLTPVASLVIRDDQVGFLRALHEAGWWLESGACDRCLIAAIDSCLNPRTLEAMARLKMLKTPDHPVGAMPGEAAVLMVVETARRVMREQHRVYGWIDRTCVTTGAPSRLGGEYAGDGLARNVSALFEQAPDQGRSTALLVANLDGSPYRALELGQLTATVLVPLAIGAAPVWIPALSFGEVRAATGPLSVAMLVRGSARGYSPPGPSLVCLMNDNDMRGSFIFRAEPGGRDGRPAR